MLDEEPRQVSCANPETRGQRIHAVRVERSCLDQRQGSLDRSPRSLPGWAEWGSLGTTPEAGAVAGTLRRGSARVEANVAREWRAHAADRPAINASRPDGHEHHPIKGGIASLQSRVAYVEVEHALLVHASRDPSERAGMMMSENDRRAMVPVTSSRPSANPASGTSHARRAHLWG